MAWRIAVIGAGPAGCAAALALAEAGFRATVYERGAPGKDKPCGDAYSPDAVAWLATHGIATTTLQALGGRPIYSTRIRKDGAQLLQFEHPAGQNGWVVPRAALDQALRDIVAPHAEIRYRTTAQDIMKQAGGWEVVTQSGDAPRTQETYDAIILAQGSGGAFARRFGVDGKPVMGASLSAYARLVAPAGLEFHYDDPYLPGYAWIFPARDDAVNLGVCALRPAQGSKLRAAGQRFTEALGIGGWRAWRGGGEALWSGQGERWHDPGGLMSCGDAAGIVDPISAEGIDAAFQTGTAAAKAIARYVAANRDEQALADYSAWVAATYRAKYALTPTRILMRAISGLAAG
jgi:flavin-dependent dehydrogenase